MRVYIVMSWLVTVAVLGFDLNRGRQLAHDHPPPPSTPPTPPSPPSPPPTTPPHAGCNYIEGVEAAMTTTPTPATSRAKTAVGIAAVICTRAQAATTGQDASTLRLRRSRPRRLAATAHPPSRRPRTTSSKESSGGACSEWCSCSFSSSAAFGDNTGPQSGALVAVGRCTTSVVAALSAAATRIGIKANTMAMACPLAKRTRR